MAQAALIFAGVGKHFAADGQLIRALENVSFTVQPRRVTGLIGPDGAGKTTLMRLAAGLYAPDAGRLELLGHDVAAEPEAVQALIGYMPQRFGLYEDLTVQENLNLYADLQGVFRAERGARFQELMEMTGLAPFTERLAGRLSGGMKQKLGLACTLLRRPRLLLLDEPTVGVDPVSRRELWHIVYRQVEEVGMTVLLSTAYLDEAERCSEVVLLHQGRVLGQGEPDRFSHAMAHRVYGVRAPALARRTLQARLAASPLVIDALVTGETVRVVTAQPQPPVAEALLPGVAGVELVPLTPRFEDAFVALLRPAAAAPGRAPEVERLLSGAPRHALDEEVIRVENLERRFGDFQAVKGISFTVRRGEVFGLLGANGAGKSTTFRMLCGLLPPSGGRATVAGHDLRRAAAEARRHIGYMAQRFSLYGNMTVTQNLRFFASAYGLRGARRRARLHWALETFELGEYAGRAASELSLGHRQRLAFAAALMHEPEVLFLDEPTSGVDPLARREFWRRTNLLASAGVTVLVTTHFMEEANYCDRLVIMAEGEVLAAGSPDQLRARVRSAALPDPTMEDAFIALLQQREAA